MSEDRSLFGDGPYPDTGPLAVLARLAFVGALLLIPAEAYLPSFTLHFARSHYIEHFAAFYVAVLCGMAAMPRVRLRLIAAAYMLFATALEALHLLGGAHIYPLVRNWTADLGGLAAACAPVVFERFRRRFAAPVCERGVS
jgi:hypothetical protein